MLMVSPSAVKKQHGNKNRQGNGDCDDHRRAPIAEEQENHGGGKTGRYQALAHHSINRGTHEERLIEECLDVELWRQRLRAPVAPLPSSASTTVSVEEPPSLNIDIRTPRTPSCRTMLVCGANPSRT